jgi:hypothetical protein
MAQVKRFIAIQIGSFLVAVCLVRPSSPADASNAIPDNQRSPVLADLPADATGPLSAERKQISDLIEEVRQRGNNVSNYENVSKYIDDRIRAGDPPDSVKHTVDELITHLTDEKNGVQHPVVTASHVTSSSAQNRGASQTSGSAQYTKELNQMRAQKNAEYKRAASHNFWQKFHDESGHHH